MGDPLKAQKRPKNRCCRKLWFIYSVWELPFPFTDQIQRKGMTRILLKKQQEHKRIPNWIGPKFPLIQPLRSSQADLEGNRLLLLLVHNQYSEVGFQASKDMCCPIPNCSWKCCHFRQKKVVEIMILYQIHRLIRYTLCILSLEEEVCYSLKIQTSWPGEACGTHAF